MITNTDSKGAAVLLLSLGTARPHSNLISHITSQDGCVFAARAAEAEIVSGHQRGPLHGVPVGIKDIIDVAGLPTTCHSKVLIDISASKLRWFSASLTGSGRPRRAGAGVSPREQQWNSSALRRRGSFLVAPVA
jgi:hypothetical protein